MHTQELEKRKEVKNDKKLQTGREKFTQKAKLKLNPKKKQLFCLPG